MSGVYHSSTTNSQLFTGCCGCAITERQNKCPSCGEEVDKNRFQLCQRPSRKERLESGIEI